MKRLEKGIKTLWRTVLSSKERLVVLQRVFRGVIIELEDVLKSLVIALSNTSSWSRENIKTLFHHKR